MNLSYIILIGEIGQLETVGDKLSGGITTDVTLSYWRLILLTDDNADDTAEDAEEEEEERLDARHGARRRVVHVVTGAGEVLGLRKVDAFVCIVCVCFDCSVESGFFSSSELPQSFWAGNQYVSDLDSRNNFWLEKIKYIRGEHRVSWRLY